MGEGEVTRSSVQAAVEGDLEKFDAIAVFFCVKGPIGDCRIFDNL